LKRAYVPVARGVHFANMGHSAPRPVPSDTGFTKFQKRLELLPEEALYLLERGSMFCWRHTYHDLAHSGLQDMYGAPMSLQQAYADMIGVEDLTLEKYQVRVSASCIK
jgi:tRNA-splicing endonuclease subunit Sen54